MLAFMATLAIQRWASAGEPALKLTANVTTGTVDTADLCPSPRNSATYKKVQKALDCAVADDTINVASGTYDETLT